MTSRSAWVAGNGVGFTWTAAFGTELASLANNNSMLSNAAAITNQSSLDMYADLSVRCQIASNTIAAGANLAIWLYALLDNDSTYGDGNFVAGTAKNATPTFPPVAIIPLIAAASQTLLVGFAQQIILPPGSFKFLIQNNSGFAFTSTAAQQNVLYRTYNINLNN